MNGGDLLYMTRALALAERGRGRTTPNPLVGAVVVDQEGVVVGRGWHEIAGGPHAEIRALADAGTRSRQATLYCTLEPCTHVGRTGPCAPEVVAAGIRRAVIAVEDPNPRVAGRGTALLRDHGVDVSVGLLADQARRMNAPFFTRMRQGRPWVTLKVAESLDGYVAARRGARTALTGAASNRFIHRERAHVDAIAVGSNTIIVDDPRLTPRGAYRYRPLIRVVFDRRLRTPPTARLLSTRAAGPVIIVTSRSAVQNQQARADALAGAGARVEPIDGDPDSAVFLQEALRRLLTLDCMSLIVEGGPRLHDAFWAAGLVDRLQVFVTPKLLGQNGVPGGAMPIGTAASLFDGSARFLSDDVLIEGYVHRVD